MTMIDRTTAELGLSATIEAQALPAGFAMQAHGLGPTLYGAIDLVDQAGLCAAWFQDRQCDDPAVNALVAAEELARATLLGARGLKLSAPYLAAKAVLVAGDGDAARTTPLRAAIFALRSFGVAETRVMDRAPSAVDANALRRRARAQDFRHNTAQTDGSWAVPLSGGSVTEDILEALFAGFPVIVRLSPALGADGRDQTICITGFEPRTTAAAGSRGAFTFCAPAEYVAEGRSRGCLTTDDLERRCQEVLYRTRIL
ncbi:MAG: hypothetical protein AAF092_11195 [Pseudomonadota bacterium]